MKTEFKKYFSEGLLIVFSVLFALLINKWAENVKKNNDRKSALETICKELEMNQKSLQSWQDNHAKIEKRLIDILEGRNDSLKNALQSKTFLHLGLLTDNKGLVDKFITKTAWETANYTGIISEFDFQTLQKLTVVYELQQELDKAVRDVLDFYLNPQNHNMEKLNLTLLHLQLRMSEVTQKELILDHYYKETIEFLKK